MRAMMLVFGLVVVLGLGAGQWACKKSPDEGTGKDHSGQMHQGHAMAQAGKMGPGAGSKGRTVDVPAQGKSFKPPIAKAQVPAGAWICDMGTVHYARAQKGDGVCPLCKMKLTPWEPKKK